MSKSQNGLVWRPCIRSVFRFPVRRLADRNLGRLVNPGRFFGNPSKQGGPRVLSPGCWGNSGLACSMAPPGEIHTPSSFKGKALEASPIGRFWTKSFHTSCGFVCCSRRSQTPASVARLVRRGPHAAEVEGTGCRWTVNVVRVSRSRHPTLKSSCDVAVCQGLDFDHTATFLAMFPPPPSF